MSKLYKHLQEAWTPEDFEKFHEGVRKAISAQRQVNQVERDINDDNALYDATYHSTMVEREQGEEMFSESIRRTKEEKAHQQSRRGKLKTALKVKASRSKGHMTMHKYQLTLRDVFRSRVNNYFDDGSVKRLMCIIGSSGAGKTLASLHLKNHCDANVICSFTTRKPRPTEVNGRDHYFVDIVPMEEEKLAYAEFGGAHYYALTGQVWGACTVYVVDEQGLIDLQERWGDRYRIFSVYIKRSNKLKRRFGVDPKRLRRDQGRKLIPENQYDWVIENNGTKREFFAVLEDIYYRIKSGQED